MKAQIREQLEKAKVVISEKNQESNADDPVAQIESRKPVISPFHELLKPIASRQIQVEQDQESKEEEKEEIVALKSADIFQDVDAKIDDPPKEIEPIYTQVKKNQFDPTAGYFYALGCSLIHMSMIITMFFIRYPNVEAAKKFDELYME